MPSEIHPPSRSVPRYRPDRPLPPYRFVPGLHPHPTRHPAGHSFGRAAVAPSGIDWQHPATPVPATWAEGVDCFNAFYFWEAHEAWEPLWRAAPHDGAARLAIQGLIQTAAALLKIHLGALSAATALAHAGATRLAESAAQVPTLFGLDLRATTSDFTHYFRPLTKRTLPPLDASVPLLRLAEVRHA